MPTKKPKTKPSKTAMLQRVSRIYDLVAEMNTLVDELFGMGVQVHIGGKASATDPLAQKAIVQITLRTDMEPLNRGW